MTDKQKYIRQSAVGGLKNAAWAAALAALLWQGHALAASPAPAVSHKPLALETVLLRGPAGQITLAEMHVARILAFNQEGQPRPVILAVLHDRQGGTERHVHELAAALRERAQFIVLRPLPGQRVSLRLPDPDEGFELVFSLQSEYPLLLDVLRQFGVCHIHYHHLLGHGDEVRRLPLRLGVGYDFTAHDFYLICPEITLTGPDGRYCGEDGPPGGSPAALAAWRQSHIAFANQARYLIGPGRDVLQRLARYLPGAPLRHVPHTDIDPARPLPAPHPKPLQGGRPLKVAVVGALSAIKGADVLEDVAAAACKNGAPVEFHLWRILIMSLLMR